MWRLVTRDLWPQLRRLDKNAMHRTAAVAYVTRADEVRFGAGDSLIVDASDHAIRSGVTATAILLAAHQRGATLFHCPGLHAKVLLFDKIAVVGSANISTTSVNLKIEAALITDDRAMVRNVRSLIAKLEKQSQGIDEKFLARIGKIKVSRKILESSRRKNVLLTANQAVKRARPIKMSRSSEANLETARRKKASKAVASMLDEHGIRLDNPRVLSFRGKTFVFTGVFGCGTHEDCTRATRALKGHSSPGNHVTSHVDVLVIGSEGSPHYLWENYGRKMKDANERRQQTQKPLIVSEYRWWKEIEHQ